MLVHSDWIYHHHKRTLEHTSGVQITILSTQGPVITDFEPKLPDHLPAPAAMALIRKGVAYYRANYQKLKPPAKPKHDHILSLNR